MGFSTSGAFILIFAGAFVALGTMYGSGANAIERVNEAEAAHLEHANTVAETEVRIHRAAWNATSTTFTLEATNTGKTTLSVEDVTVLVDGQYLALSAFESRTVEGRETRIWRPGETLSLRDDDSVLAAIDDTEPDRAKLVTGPGVAAIAEVTDA